MFFKGSEIFHEKFKGSENVDEKFKGSENFLENHKGFENLCEMLRRQGVKLCCRKQAFDLLTQKNYLAKNMFKFMNVALMLFSRDIMTSATRGV